MKNDMSTEVKITNDSIIPNPPPVELPAETHLISEVLPKPDPSDKNYLTITSSSNPGKVFNFHKRATRNIKISGMTINWDKSCEELMSYNNNQDIENIEIYADSLSVGAKLCFPQTNIKIYARSLKFKGKDSCIDTTPVFITEKPDLTKNGANGIKGGNIEVYVNSFENDPKNTTPFIMNGTKGQPGGDGKLDEVADIDMKGTKIDGFRYFQNCSKFDKLGGDNVVYYYLHYDDPASYYGAETAKEGRKEWPKDGASAKAAGKPGIGGAGGDLKSTISDLNKYCNLNGGESGPVGALKKGQRGGRPSPAYWQDYQRRIKNCGKPDEYVCEEDVHHTKAGRDAPAPKPDKPQGNPGNFSITNGIDYAWLHPALLETAVQFYSDVFLNGYYEDAAAGLKIYKDALDKYENPPQEFEYKFMQTGHEMQVMLNRLVSNTDYYGNPAGWVPMLSFESNMLLYKNEVKNSIQTMYLAYRINIAAQKEEAAKSLLQNSITQLQSEVQNAIKDYSEALNLIPQLDQDFNNISTAITTYTEHLKVVEAELLEQAKHDVEMQQAIKLSLRIFSGILQMIPVGQPELGVAGKGLDIISNIDIDKPLDSFGEMGTLFAKYTESKLKDNAKKTKDTIDSNDTKDQNKAGDSSKKIIEASKNLESGLKEISGAVSDFSVSEDQVQAELEKLEAQNEEYQEVKEHIEELNKQKTQLAKKLTDTLQQLNTSVNTINSGLQKIDCMNSQLSLVFSALNHEAILYAKKMEQSAAARLVRYQYYLVKAYQYRILEVCPGVDYQLKYIFDAFVKLLDPTSDGHLTDSQFNTLMTVYQQPIKEMANNIISQYNASGPQLATKYIVPLEKEQINELNTNNSVTINLMQMGYWDFSQQGLRVTSLGADKIEIEGDADEIAKKVMDLTSEPAIINLMYIHSGFSTLRSDGKLYGFRPKKDDNVMRWGTTYNINKPKSKRITPIVPSPSDQSLLSLLIDPEIKNPDILTQYRPSACADITITKQVLPSGTCIDIKTLNLAFDFVFFPVSVNEVSLFIKNDGNVAPYFTIDREDLNSRQDGRGSFLRIYSKGTSITIKASLETEKQVKYKFSKWTDSSGKVISTDNPLTLKLDSNIIVKAEYEKS